MERKKITYLTGPLKGKTVEKSKFVANLFIKKGLAEKPKKEKPVEKEEKEPAETKEDKTVATAKTKGKK